jgi:hypothetical protein
VVPSSSTGRTYELLRIKGLLLGAVFAGPGALVPADSSLRGSQWNVGWRVEVHPGETVSLLRFLVQRDADDQSAAQSAAQSLADLSNPEALTGLSAEDRARIVNFVIP